MAMYSKVEYWNERYRASRNHPPYDWYQNYTSLSHLLNPETLSGFAGFSGYRTTSPNTLDDDASACTAAIDNATASKAYQRLQPNRCRVLILGCGNSTLGADMYEAGWRGGFQENGFVQTDFSPVVIEQMQQRYNDDYYRALLGNASETTARMEFLCHDVTKSPLPYENGSFDLIICKGLFDAILCSVGSVANIRRLVKESIRLLSDDGGVLLVCTYGNPDNRVVFLEDERGDINTYWQGVGIHPIPSIVRAQKPSNHSSNKNDYVYVCRKRSGAWNDITAHWPNTKEATAALQGGSDDITTNENQSASKASNEKDGVEVASGKTA